MQAMISILALAVSISVAGCATDVSQNVSKKIAMEEFMVPAVDSGISLYVRNKHPEGAQRFAGENILLYVHGATYPSETAFDLQLNGLSWMDYIANQGYDVYLVDLRGYGKSTRPVQMDQPADQNAPIVRTETAGQGCWGRGRFHFEAACSLQDQFAGLVLGDQRHGLVYGAEQRQGEQVSVVRASVDTQYTGAH